MLNQEQFKNDLKAVLIEVSNVTGDQDEALDVYADRLSKIFIKHIKTLEIVYTNGLTAPNGPVSGVLNHTVK
jgi:hypothetical protein